MEKNGKGIAIHRSVQIGSAMAEASIESQWRSSEWCGDALISKGIASIRNDQQSFIYKEKEFEHMEKVHVRLTFTEDVLIPHAWE